MTNNSLNKTKKAKVAIIGAMEVEIELLKKKIESLKEIKEGGFKFYSGTIAGVEVVVLLSGIGKVAAAVGATLIIERYNPDYIINTGTAGGLGNGVQTGDIIIGDRAFYHDVDVTVFGYKIGQMAGQPEFFEADNFLLGKMNKAINSLKTKQNTIVGDILSGDSFMSDRLRVNEVKLNFPDALAIDMESAAIAQVCSQLNTPFITIRSISDIAGDGDAEFYESFVKIAGNISARIVVKFLESF